jgi:hypothetical protein
MELAAQLGLKEGDQWFQVDLDEEVYATLARAAARLAGLLEDPILSDNSDLFGPLDDLLGALYALIFAQSAGFRERGSERAERLPPRKRARQLERGVVRTDGAWIAGFHLNSALYRISAVRDRVLQVVTKRKNGKLAEHASALFLSWTGDSWSYARLDLVRKEVNRLKHNPGGVVSTREVGPAIAGSAMEELLDLVEAWSKRPEV